MKKNTKVVWTTFWCITCLTAGYFLAGCGEKADTTTPVEMVKKTARQTTEKKEINPDAAKVIAIKDTENTYTGGIRYISFGGQCTNILYEMDERKWAGIFHKRTLGQLKEYCKKHPDNADAWFLLGKKYYDQGHLAKKSADAFAKAIECAPDAFFPRMYYAETFAAREDVKTAVELYRNAFTYAKTPIEKSRWTVSVQVWANIYKRKSKSPAWAENLLTEYEDQTPYVHAARVTMYEERREYDTMFECAFAGIAVTTNARVHQKIVERLPRYAYMLSDAQKEKYLDVINKANLSELKKYIYSLNLRQKYDLSAQEKDKIVKEAFAKAKTQEDKKHLKNDFFIYSLLSGSTNIFSYIDDLYGTNAISFNNAIYFVIRFDESAYSNEVKKIVNRAKEHASPYEKMYFSLISVYKQKDIDFSKIDEYAQKYSDNPKVLKLLTDVYRWTGKPLKEIEQREALLGLANSDTLVPQEIDELIDCYAKENVVDAANIVCTKYYSLLTNSPRYISTAVKVHLAKGETNTAFDLLYTTSLESSEEYMKNSVFQKMLNTDWLTIEQKARVADAAWSHILQCEDSLLSNERANMAQNIATAYLEADRLEHAIEAAKESIKAGGDVNVLRKLIQRIPNRDTILQCINEISAFPELKPEVILQLAHICTEHDMSETALELYKKLQNIPEADEFILDNVHSMLRFATDQKDTAFQNKILTVLRNNIATKKTKNNHIISFISAITDNDIAIDYEPLVMEYVRTLTTPEDYLTAVQSLVSDIQRTGNTGLVQRLLANPLANSAHNIDAIVKYAEIYAEIGEDDTAANTILMHINSVTNMSSIIENAENILQILSKAQKTNEMQRLTINWLQSEAFNLEDKRKLLYSVYRHTTLPDSILLELETSLADIPSAFRRSIMRMTLARIYTEKKDIEGVRRLAQTHTSHYEKRMSYVFMTFAELFMDLDSPADALEMYQKALEGGKDTRRMEDEAGIYREIAGVYLELGNTEKAVENALLAVQSDPNDDNYKDILAKAYKENGQYKDALDIYVEKLTGTDSTYYHKNIIPKIAEILAERAIEIDISSIVDSILSKGRSSESLMTAAQLYTLGNDLESAEEVYNEAMSAAQFTTEKKSVHEKWMAVVYERGDEKQIISALENGMNLYTGEEKAQKLSSLAYMLQNAEEYDAVLSLFEKYDIESLKINNDYRYAQLQQLRSQAYLEKGDVDAAWSSAQLMLQDDPKKQNAYMLKKYMDIAEQAGKSKEAQAYLVDIYDTLPQNSQAQMLPHVVEHYKSTGESDKLEIFIENTKAKAQNVGTPPDEKIAFANTLFDIGEAEAAHAILKEQATGPNDNYQQTQAYELLANIYIKDGDLDGALEWGNKQPETAESLAFLAKIHAEKNNKDEARELYEKALSNDDIKDYKEKMLLSELAKLYEGTGDDSAINKLAEKAREMAEIQRENEVYGMKAAAGIYSAAGQYDLAIDEYKDAMKEYMKPKEYKNLQKQYAQCLSKAGENDDAVEVYEDILKDDSVTFEERIQLHNSIAQEYDKAHRTSEAKDAREEVIDTCEKFLKEHETGSRAMSARFTLATAYKDVGDKDEARKVLEKITKKFPGTSAAKRAEKECEKLNGEK